MYKFRQEKDGGSTNCYPVDDENTMWIQTSEITLAEIVGAYKSKWPDAEFYEISVTPYHHHQYSIYYDLHDSSDYVDYIILSRDPV
jgi:hypothetical protein